MSCPDLEGAPSRDPKSGWGRDIQWSIRPWGSVAMVASLVKSGLVRPETWLPAGPQPPFGGNLFEAGVLYPTQSLVNASCTNSSLEQSCWFSHPSPTCPLGATEQPGGGLVMSPSCGMRSPQVLGWFLGLGGCTERHCLARGDVFGRCLSDSNGGGGMSQLVQCSSGTAPEGVGLPGPKSSKNNGEKEK